MTQRLYHQDAYLREFEATVTAVRAADGGPAVALDRTAFSPTAGGQPCDRGQLAGRRVLDVREEDDEIWHVLEASGALQDGDRVHGRIDWERRFDHMQQHTGQHILSQAFLQTRGVQTIAVHMGQTCTLDLATADLTASDVESAERLANAVVLENRPVLIREVEPEEAEAMGLRRPPTPRARIRVVEVEGFDRSACGGTHVRTTCGVGPITVRGWERYKGGVRVEFLCGWRVLRDYHGSRGVLRDLVGQLTTGEADLPSAVARLRERLRGLERDLTDARARLLEAEADRLIGETGDPHLAAVRAPEERVGLPEPRVVGAVLAGRPIEDLRGLARALIARARCVAILAADPDRRLLVARSPGLGLDATAILRDALAGFGGRGGGKPEAAEGAAPDAPSAAALVDAARAAARRHLEARRA
ncbi:MAG: alanyl-tRNA editing protein [Armatimonadota bacterium]|nr:alanyl-tRNA editing protein [Armatimonadota bacterium]MDR7518405.1 alanyl-tRNA editing protein [Armatimonadota bacterium]MDR7549313.1 alanyl-tRNA editing protein [Armatimonadota bacterium]